MKTHLLIKFDGQNHHQVENNEAYGLLVQAIELFIERK